MTEKRHRTPIQIHRYVRYDICDTNMADTDTTYKPSPGAMKGHIIIKTIFIVPLNYVKQNANKSA